MGNMCSDRMNSAEQDLYHGNDRANKCLTMLLDTDGLDGIRLDMNPGAREMISLVITKGST